MQITGLDLSLTGTGICRLSVTGGGHAIDMATITSTGTKNATLADRTARLADLQRRIVHAATPADLVVIEYPTLSQGRQGGHLDRHGLWWLVVDWLTGVAPVATITASSLKKYATGRGNADKADMRVAWLQRHGDDVRDDNQVDAAFLACAGAHRLGHPVLALPKTHTVALDKGDWPDLPTTPTLAGVGDLTERTA